ncbi:MAG: PD40 domain-containing protein [Gammaproteobacteria bacterium]|nr:PD40 domain-containing protein [Gammaproteobacteria bacterium]
MNVFRRPSITGPLAATLLLTLSACDRAEVETDAMSSATADAPMIDHSKELPVRLVPNIPPAAEAYYAPDDYHFIAQARDPDAQSSGDGRIGGALTYIFSEDGKVNRRINDRGQDACSYFFPDQERVIWTSTRDNMDMPLGSWSDPKNYPHGAELYTSDLYGNDIVRLTHDEWYDAEVTVSPNGEWIVWTKQIDSNANLWRMRPDGSDKTQITFTEDWQPGAPFYLPDNETIIFQAWRASEHGKVFPTPMTVFTIKADGSELTQRTFTRDMYWGPAPAGDGRHYLYTTVIDDGNWELFLGDLGGEEPRRLTYNTGFDGMKSFSKASDKMLFVRTAEHGELFMTHVMDLSSLNLGAENYQGIPATPVPDDAMLVTDFTAGR